MVANDVDGHLDCKVFANMSTGATNPNADLSPEQHIDKKNSIPNTLKESDAMIAANAVLKHSIPMPATSTRIRGVDFNDFSSSSPITVRQLTSYFSQTGFQATSIGRAIEIINNMVHPPPTFLTQAKLETWSILR
jgi:hypothetical protein